MMGMISLMIVVICSSLCAEASLKPCAHSINEPAPCFIAERRTTFDRKLYDHEAEKSAIMLIKRDEDITFPPGGPKSNWFRLTSVRVINKMPQGTEGTVTMTEGGVGHQNVTLHLESQRGEGYHFHIVIRGEESFAVKHSIQTPTVLGKSSSFNVTVKAVNATL